MASASSRALPVIYREAFATFKRFEDGEINIKDQNFAETLSGLVAQFKECLVLIDTHSLFSSNEEVEDVVTSHLKYDFLFRCQVSLASVGHVTKARLRYIPFITL